MYDLRVDLDRSQWISVMSSSTEAHQQTRRLLPINDNEMKLLSGRVDRHIATVNTNFLAIGIPSCTRH